MSTIFPKWTNHLPTAVAVGGLGTLCSVVGIVWYYFTPKFWEVGYMPTQPGSGFPHHIHVGKLGMDCRYCHSKVEVAAEANIPNVATCAGCHAENFVRDDVVQPARIQFVREAYAADESIPWRRVHKLPDYVRNFPHNVHVRAGVSCYSCHGMIGRMPVVNQREPLSMGWCLDCHRDPAPSLVPPERVTDIFWVEEQLASGTAGQRNVATERSPGGEALLRQLLARPLSLMPENCGACHY
ncbi:MAG TPA: cytochrome c3 family protein [Phycisphaerales bacterium]|nr:cytochrome c3 family protein [Phycisphaerales bacterium]